MATPCVSFVIAAFNAAPHIVETLQSVASCGVDDYNIVLVDDGSTDGTYELACRYLRSDRDLPIKINRNVGPSMAWNIGLSETDAPYIARLDADDLCLNSRVHHQIAHMENNKEVAFCGCDKTYIDGPRLGHAYPKGQEWCNRRLLVECCYPNPGITFHRERMGDEFYYDPRYTLCEDYELWSRLFVKDVYGDNVDTCGLAYRVHKSSVSFGKYETACNIDLFLRHRMLSHVLSSKSTRIAMTLAFLITFRDSVIVNTKYKKAIEELAHTSKAKPPYADCWQFSQKLLLNAVAAIPDDGTPQKTVLDLLRHGMYQFGIRMRTAPNLSQTEM